MIKEHLVYINEVMEIGIDAHIGAGEKIEECAEHSISEESKKVLTCYEETENSMEEELGEDASNDSKLDWLKSTLDIAVMENGDYWYGEILCSMIHALKS